MFHHFGFVGSSPSTPTKNTTDIGFKAPVITTPITQYECALNDCCGEEGISRV